jgi:methyl-accepting chemotaxis protein
MHIPPIFSCFARLQLRQKLPLLIMGAGLLTGGLVGTFAIIRAGDDLSLETQNRLLSIAETRRDELQRYLKTIQQDLRFNATNPLVINALNAFSSGWDDLGAAGYNPRDYLQKWYIQENPNPTGSKEKLDYAPDGSNYSKTHAAYHPWFRTFLNERGYYDIFLIDASGRLVYSVFKELDYATNLQTGKWKDSDLGNAFRAALNGNPNQQYFFDFKPYAPSHGAPASFISQPIADARGNTIGVLVYQMPIDAINSIMQSAVGLGETGETLFVGRDGLMRNNSRFAAKGESTILSRKVDNDALSASLNGQTGATYAMTEGKEVFIAYTPMTFLGTQYGLLASIDSAEKNAAITNMIITIILGIIGVSVVVVTLGIVFSRQIATRINNMASTMALMEKGENVTIPDMRAHDEIGDIARALSGINDIGQNALRVQGALDSTNGNVMMADADYNIIYMNPSILKMLSANEEKIRKDLPHFDASKLIGSNIDALHKEPSHQREMLDALTSTYKSTLSIGGAIFDLTVNPVMNRAGERIGTVVEWNNVTQERAVEKEVAEVVEAASRGDFSKRLATEGRDGFMLQLCEGINNVCSTSLSGLSDVNTVLQQLAKGNLTQRIEKDYEGLFNDIKQSVNATIDNLLKVVRDIKLTAESVTSAASEVSAGSEDLSHRTEEQASTLEETAASMEELTGTVTSNAELASNANTLSKETGEVAVKGQEVVNEAVTAMESIESSSQKISDIIGTIDEIAFQTNLLALNAAVEAARAGEAGKGFAVVASEVRSLAGRSASASKEIKDLINNSVSEIANGVSLVNRSGASLGEIVASVERVASLIQDIASASREQSAGIQEVNTAVAQMDEATQQNAALVEESTAAAQSMADDAKNLLKLVSVFKTEASSDAS